MEADMKLAVAHRTNQKNRPPSDWRMTNKLMVEMIDA